MNFYLSLILFSLVSAITPGPNNISLLISSSVYGIKETMPQYLGVVFGYPVMLFVLGLGLSTIFVQHPLLHMCIKYLGSAYIMYIAWKIINSSLNQEDHKSKGRPITFMQSVLFQWVNPKGVIMGISVISMYTNPKAAIGLVSQIVIVATVALFATIVSAAPWVFGGAILRGLLRHNFHVRIFNIVMATLLVVSIIMLLLSH